MFELRAVERPYPGLRAFEPHEAEIFFGREAHTDRLLGILQRERFLAVIGPSGSGKSSLVRAGLLPGLAMGSLGTGSDWRIALLRPGDRPMRSLAAALLQPQVLGRHLLSHEGEPDAADIAALEAELRRGPLALATLCAEAQRRHRADAGDGAAVADFNLLVLVDQFEEIFTYADAGGQQAADESDAFVNLLLAARADAKSRPAEPGLHVALTMRTDFLGNCVRFFDLPEAINHAQYLTPRLKRDEIERAIRGPAELWGGRIDESLVAELINSTARSDDQLPLVQHALARMWAEAFARQKFAPVIDWDVAKSIGGVEGAIQRHAESLWQHLTLSDRVTSIGVFTAITERRAADDGGQDVRRPQTLGRIAKWLGQSLHEVAEVVRYFSAPDVCFLHSHENLDERSVIDLSHEALIRQWPELQSWVADEFDRAVGYRKWQARAFEHQLGSESLLTGSDLRRAQAWLAGGERGPVANGHVSREALDISLTSHWALRYLTDEAIRKIDAAHARGDSSESVERLALVLAEQELGKTRSFIADSSSETHRIQRAETDRLERERDFERQLADAARGQALRANKQAVFLTIFSAIAIALALMSAWSWQRAKGSERTANIALREAIQRRTASDAEALFAGRKVGGDAQSFRLALASLRISSSPEVLGILQQIAATNATKIIEQSAAQLSVAFSPDGKRIVGGGYDNAIRVWDAQSGNLIGKPFLGHSGKVRSVMFSPDGSRIVSGSSDHTIRIWNALTGELIGKPIAEYEYEVEAIAYSPDGLRIASGDSHGSLMLWDAHSGKAIAKPLSGHTRAVNCIAYSPDGNRIVSGSDDGMLRLWDARSGASIGAPWEGHSWGVNSVAFSLDGKRVVSGGNDGILRMWDAASGEQIGRPIKGNSGEVRGVGFNPDGIRIVSGGADGNLRVWNANTREPIEQPIQSIKSQKSPIIGVAVSPDGSRIVSSHYNALRVWDIPSIEMNSVLLNGKISVLSLAFNSEGTKIASGGEDNTVMVWDSDTGRPIGRPLEGHTRPVLSVDFSRDGGRIVSGSADATLRVWDASSGKPIGAPIKGHTDLVYGVAFSPDGNLVASASADKTLRLWDAHSGLPIGQPLKGHASAVLSVAFSPDGRTIVSGSDDMTVRLWDVSSGEPLGQAMKGHSFSVTSVAYSPRGDRIVSGSWDHSLILWDTHTNRAMYQPLKGHTGLVNSVRFSPDGRRIVSGSQDGTLRLWDAFTGEAIGKPMMGHSRSVRAVAFNPDGVHIASSSLDGTLRLWNLFPNEPLRRPLVGHKSQVLTVAISPDGSYIASGSKDKTVRLWDLKSGWPIGNILRGHTDRVNSVAFSPDGTLVASGSSDNTVRIWGVQSGKLIGTPLVHMEKIKDVSFSPDGNRIIAVSFGGIQMDWDARSGTRVGPSVDGRYGITKDGGRTYSISKDKQLIYWDLRSGRRINTPITKLFDGDFMAISPDGNRIAVNDILWDANSGAILGDQRIGLKAAFSPYGSFLASADSASNLRLWDSLSGKPIGEPLAGHLGVVTSIVYSPDGRSIVSGSEDGTVRVWPSPQGWIDKICSVLTRNFAPEEWEHYVGNSIEYTAQCPNLPVPIRGEYPMKAD